MTTVKGLDEILFACRPREEQCPTTRQLDFVREKLGEEELDRIILLNLNRGQVTKIIGDWIDSQPKRRRFYERNTYCDLYGRDHGWGDDWDEEAGSYSWDEPYYGVD